MEILISKAKIQNFKYSYFAYLPLEWIRENKLKKGDTIYYILNERGELRLENESPIKNVA